MILEGAGNGQKILELWTKDDYHGDLKYEAWLATDEVRMCVIKEPVGFD